MEEERKKPQAFSKQLQAQTLAKILKEKSQAQREKRKREEGKRREERGRGS